MRKVYQKLSSLWLLLIAFLAVPSVALAQDIPSLDVGEGEESTKIKLHEDFDYATGNLIDQDKWLQYGNNTAGRIQVVDKTLEYANYPGGVKGKSIQLKPEPSGEDLCIRFDPSEEGIKSGNIYYSALINVTGLPSSVKATSQLYTLAMLIRTKACNVGEKTASGANFSSTEFGRLFIVKADEGSEEYKIGIDRGANNPVYADGTFALNTTHLIVVKYGAKTGVDGSNAFDEVKLYVDPTDFTTEPEQASAQTDVNTTGSQINNYGIQGFELRQGSNGSTQCAEMYVGALHFAQTYADLFTASEGGGDTPSEPAIPAKSTINVSKSDNFLGETFVGYPKSKTIMVKGINLAGDVTVEIAGTEVTADKTTLSKEEVESEEGAQLTLTVTPTSDEQKTLVTFRSEGAEDVSIQYEWQAIAYTDVAKIRDITAREGGDYDYYRYTGKAVVTFIDKTTNYVYVQDSTASIIISGKDHVEAGLTLPAVGDSITGFLGTVEQSLGSIVFTPDVYLGLGQVTMGTVVSQGNEIEPIVTTLAEIKAAPKNYLNKLVRINGVEVTTDAVNFAEGMTQPTISDGTESGKMRIFKGTSLIGAVVPIDDIDLIGLSTSASAVIIAPRGADDLKEPVADDPELTVTAPAMPLTGGKVGQTTVLGTIHISAKNMPAATTIEITGANRAMFAASVAEIKAGSSETDIDITYTPTAIGKHAGRVNIDCPEVPELSQAITLSAYAIDEQNPPVLSAAADSVICEAKAGETVEQSIEIKTANLPDYANVKLANADVFRLSTTMLMKNATTPLKVTFVPLTAGTYENEIIVAALGADTLRIPVKGVATDNTTPAVPVEGDELPLNPDPAVTLLNEHFDNGERNKPLSIEGWKNIAIEGTRAWWNYSFSDADESAGEHVAKVTAYDSKVEDGNEEPVEMLLVTPALDFKHAASKIFTFRVRGDYLTDNQSDELQLLYIEAKGDEMLELPIDGFTMPCTKDESGEWFEYHIDFTDQQLADTFFIGFRFTSIRGRYNSATYYIDDVSFGRTDIPVVRPNVPSLAFTATPGKDATSDEVTVTSENLTEPIKLTLGGANKSKFKLSVSELPAEGGAFTIKFNSDVEGVHEAYVKLASRGAADKYVVLSVNNSVQSGIANISATPADITIYSLDAVVIKSAKAITPAAAVKGLPAGTYILQKVDAGSIQRFKIAVK